MVYFVSLLQIKAIDGDGSHSDYESRKAKNECMNTGMFCIISIAIFIFAGLINTPSFIESIPGGTFTTTIIGVGIFVSVILLCMQQRPRAR